MFDLGGLANLPLQIWQMCKSLHFEPSPLLDMKQKNIHTRSSSHFYLKKPGLTHIFKHLDKKLEKTKSSATQSFLK